MFGLPSPKQKPDPKGSFAKNADAVSRKKIEKRPPEKRHLRARLAA
jgi:hypothetical protein